MTRVNEPQFPLAGRRVWVAGHKGMVGSALLRRLAREDCETVKVARDEVDLLDTWHTVGMRGTFSADVSVDDVFVPDRRVALVDRDRERAPAFAERLDALGEHLAAQGHRIRTLRP